MYKRVVLFVVLTALFTSLSSEMAFAQQPCDPNSPMRLKVEQRGSGSFDSGLLTAKMLEHFSNNGWSVIFEPNNKPNIEIISYLNYSEHRHSTNVQNQYYSNYTTYVYMSASINLSATVRFSNGRVCSVSASYTIPQRQIVEYRRISNTIRLRNGQSYTNSNDERGDVQGAKQQMYTDILQEGTYRLMVQLNQIKQ